MTAVLIEESRSEDPRKGKEITANCPSDMYRRVDHRRARYRRHQLLPWNDPAAYENTDVLITITAAIEIRIAFGIVLSGSMTSSLAVVISPYPM